MRRNKAQVAKASAAFTNAEHSLRIARLMLGESMARLEALLDARKPSLRSLHVAALEVHRDSGELYTRTAVAADLADWLRQARIGKRRKLRGGPAKWPSMGYVLNVLGPRRRRRAERTAHWEDRNP